MNRRLFLSILGAPVLDPERLLWRPGKKFISIPKAPEIYVQLLRSGTSLSVFSSTEKATRPAGASVLSGTKWAVNEELKRLNIMPAHDLRDLMQVSGSDFVSFGYMGYYQSGKLSNDLGRWESLDFTEPVHQLRLVPTRMKK